MSRATVVMVLCICACGGELAADPAPDANTVGEPEAAAPTDASIDGHDASVLDAGADEPEPSGFPFHATGQPGRLAIDDTYVYWTENSGNVRRIGKDGSDPTFLAKKQIGPFGITVDATGVYFVASAVKRVNPDGGSPITLVPVQFGAISIAVTGGYVFWTTFDTKNATVMRADLDGSNVTTIATGASLRWLAAGGGHVFWAGGDLGGAVMRADLDGGNQTTLATNTMGYNGVVVGATRVFFADQSCVLASAPLDATTTTTIATRSPMIYGMPLTTWGDDVYWGWGEGLQTAPGDGGAPTTVVKTDPTTIAVDANYVFYFDNSFYLWRMPK